MPENTVRVVLLADTHGHLDSRVEAVALAAPIVVHAGDIGGRAVLDTLGSAGARVVAVRGNTDTPAHWPDSELDTLAALPDHALLELPGGTLAVEHGDRFAARTRHRELRARHRDCAAVVCGHSHRRLTDLDALPWILNPGAAGRSRPYGGPGCLLLHAEPGRWTVETRRFEPRLHRRR